MCLNNALHSQKSLKLNALKMNDSGYQDVDYVLTTRELIRMVEEAGLDFKKPPGRKS